MWRWRVPRWRPRRRWWLCIIYTRYYTLYYAGAGPRDGGFEAHLPGAADPGPRLRAGHAAATRHQTEARRHQGGRHTLLIT